MDSLPAGPGSFGTICSPAVAARAKRTFDILFGLRKERVVRISHFT
jgi:hypothetical protein